MTIPRWTRDRIVTAGVLLAASAVMMFPLVVDGTGGNVPLVQNLGFAAGERAPWPAWAAALLFAVAYIGVTFWALPSVVERQRELSLFKTVGLLAAFASGVMEEVVFRRWLMDWAMSAGVDGFGQILLSSMAFGLAHSVWHGLNFDWRFSLRAIFATTVAGALLAAIYIFGGRNLGPCIMAHILINAVIEPWLVLDAVSHRRPSRASSDTLPSPD